MSRLLFALMTSIGASSASLAVEASLPNPYSLMPAAQKALHDMKSGDSRLVAMETYNLYLEASMCHKTGWRFIFFKKGFNAAAGNSRVELSFYQAKEQDKCVWRHHQMSASIGDTKLGKPIPEAALANRQFDFPAALEKASSLWPQPFEAMSASIEKLYEGAPGFALMLNGMVCGQRVRVTLDGKTGDVIDPYTSKVSC